MKKSSGARPATRKALPAPVKFRGQGTLCHGTLHIALSGPQGVGKSLVSKILQDLLPLTAVDEVVILEQ